MEQEVSFGQYRQQGLMLLSQRSTRKQNAELRNRGFGFFQDGDVGIGVFPGGEEIFDASVQTVCLSEAYPPIVRKTRMSGGNWKTARLWGGTRADKAGVSLSLC